MITETSARNLTLNKGLIFVRMEDLYERLRLFVPKTTVARLSNTLALLEKLCRDVIAKSRLITFSTYLSSLPDEHLASFAFRDRLQNLVCRRMQRFS
jgi:hypothetical protein